MTAAGTHDLTELDVRESDGIVVSLLWSRHSDEVSVRVEDRVSGTARLVGVPRAAALDAFHHPFAYLPDDEPAGLLVA